MTKAIKEKEKDLQYYVNHPYTVTLRKDEDGDFVAKIVELEGCSAHGADAAEALANLDEAKSLWIEDALESGERIPLPEDDTQLPSGKWLQRVPRSLHKKLVARAEREGVSLNQLVTSLLAECVGIGAGAEQTAEFMKDMFVDLVEAWSPSPLRHWGISPRPLGSYCMKLSDEDFVDLGPKVIYESNATVSASLKNFEVTNQIVDWVPTSIVIKPEALKQHVKKR